MKICFVANDKKWGGLANNGGSKTIIKSAQTLANLGHETDIVSNVDKFTWFNHKKTIHKIPKDTDVVIAVSVSEIDNVINDSPKKARKFWWARALETWRMREKKIVEKARKINLITNSTWLHKLFGSYGIQNEMVWPGVDLEFWENREKPTDCCNIGFLYHEFHKTKRYDLCVKLMEKMYRNDYYSFGVGVPKDKRCLDQYKTHLDQPGWKLIRVLYQTCHIWFAPTELDSFHNPPPEANLCGCLIVCNRKPSNGMIDYATDETAMRFDTWDELIDCIEQPDYSKVAKMQDVLKNKIGNREKNMKKMLDVIK